MSNVNGSTVVGMAARGVKVDAKRSEPDENGKRLIWLSLSSWVFGEGDGYNVTRVSFDATDVRDLVDLGNEIRGAIAELVLAEYPDPGLTVDAPVAEVPTALAEAAPGATFVPIGWADLAVGDWVVDKDHDAGQVTTPREGDGDACVEYGYSAAERLMRYHPNSAYVASCWRQVPGSPEDLT